ncbi:hypothetical protein [Flammeovirga kamogawensis]|nr:hypothetical protein [Flammeovirga kamogawensis]MBB6463087.1 hypothetical protein [Flammeovirga kamogawensis]
MDKEIVGIILGGYFTAMGVFKIGCQSSTSCCGGNCNTTQKEEK